MMFIWSSIVNSEKMFGEDERIKCMYNINICSELVYWNRRSEAYNSHPLVMTNLTEPFTFWRLFNSIIYDIYVSDL